MGQTNRPEPGMRSALWGFFEGALCCLVFFGIIGYLQYGKAAWGQWPVLAALVVAGGAVFALGMGLSGRREGAVIGAVMGILLGGAFSSLLPAWNVKYALPAPAATGRELTLEGPGLDGKSISVADYRGKVLLVDFWATWCPPC